MSKSVRELELIIQRLNAQIDSKNEQIEELNGFIQKATYDTQELIRNFRAFCIKVLESQLAYGDITSRDLESMSLNDLLSRAKDMLKQNQEKARSMYNVFKQRLSQKNKYINSLENQISQLKSDIDAFDKAHHLQYDKSDDEKRTASYMLDTDTKLDALKPAMSTTTVLDENEHQVNFDDATDYDAAEVVAEGQMYIQNVDAVKEQMKEFHWFVLEIIVSRGISEVVDARKAVSDEMLNNNDLSSSDKFNRAIKVLVNLSIFNQTRISTGIRWFTIIKLTELGRKLYVEKFKKQPVETEYQRIIREHDNVEHGYIIKDVVQILESSGKYRSVSMSRRANAIKLPNGKTSIPDVVACMQNSIEYYEIECGNHHQSDFEDKCNKLKQITPNLYFIAPNRDVAEKKLRPQIEGWIRSVGLEELRLSGIVVYLTSISDFAAEKCTYVYNMQGEQPIYIEDTTKEK